MLIVTTLNLGPYVGQRLVLSELRVGGKGHQAPGPRRQENLWRGRRHKVMLEHLLGTFNGPVYVRAQLTRAEYLAQKEDEVGRPLTQAERDEVVTGRYKFFLLSVD